MKNYLEKEEKLDLVALAQAGDIEARDKLIQGHQDTVYKLANAAHNRTGLDLNDLEQEATVALIYAINSFNPQENDNFSGWAYRIIEFLLRTYVRKNHHMLRSSSRVKATAIDVFQTRDYLTSKHKREVSSQEIAKFLEITKEKIDLATLATTSVASLDKPINDGESISLMDIIPDSSIQMPDEMQDYWLEKLQKGKACLTKREQIVLETLIKKEKGATKKLQEEFDLSHSSISNIYNDAIRKLKKHFKVDVREEPVERVIQVETVNFPPTRAALIHDKRILFSHVSNHYPMNISLETFIENLDRILEHIPDENFSQIVNSYGRKNVRFNTRSIRLMREIYFEIYSYSRCLRSTSPKVSATLP